MSISSTSWKVEPGPFYHRTTKLKFAVRLIQTTIYIIIFCNTSIPIANHQNHYHVGNYFDALYKKKEESFEHKTIPLFTEHLPRAVRVGRRPLLFPWLLDCYHCCCFMCVCFRFQMLVFACLFWVFVYILCFSSCLFIHFSLLLLFFVYYI